MWGGEKGRGRKNGGVSREERVKKVGVTDMGRRKEKEGKRE